MQTPTGQAPTEPTPSAPTPSTTTASATTESADAGSAPTAVASELETAAAPWPEDPATAASIWDAVPDAAPTHGDRADAQPAVAFDTANVTDVADEAFDIAGNAGDIADDVQDVADDDVGADDDDPEEDVVDTRDRFGEFALPEPLLRAIDDLGFSHCTKIQSAALPYSLADYDVTGQAQTGTGKTAAFLITIFTRLCEQRPRGVRKPGAPRSLVLAPTRELAMQIEKDARDLGKYLPFGILCVVGGMDFDRQKATLDNEVIDLLVATPGRLIDFLNRSSVNLRQVEVLVIDEADRMLDMGFIPDVRRIVYRTPHKKERQTLFFSATFNFDVLNLAKQWTLEPMHVAIEPERIAVDTIDQRVYLTSQRDKFKVLFNLIAREELSRVLIFANRRDVTRDICERLQGLGVACEMLSGEVPQRKRLKALEQFREGVFPVLIATDVAGRGIHIDGVSHVINYNLPEDPEDYVHRIGRTGRAGNLGTSIALVSEEDAFELPRIEALLGRPVPCEHPAPELLAALPEPMMARRDTAAAGAERVKPRERDRSAPRRPRRPGP